MKSSLSFPLLLILTIPTLFLQMACQRETVVSAIDVATTGPITYDFEEDRRFECEEPYDYEGILFTVVKNTLPDCEDWEDFDCTFVQAYDSLELKPFVWNGSVMKIDLTQLTGYSEIELEVGNFCGVRDCFGIGFFNDADELLQKEPMAPWDETYDFTDLPEDLAYLAIPGCETKISRLTVK
ncbi:MAG: hypothetical protein AAF399_16585 [Bacteroidota bacterium]